MPGWEYDNRLGTMVPKKRKGLEFHAVTGGLKVVDNDLDTSFIILRRTDEISYAQGIAATRGVKLYDYRKAMQIADRVKRVLPSSQYTNYRKFCKGVPESVMTDEDKGLLETLVNGYGNSLNEAVEEINAEHLNEAGHLFTVVDPGASDGQTRGATDYHGVSGLVKSLPSAALAFLICPPLAMIQLLGSVRVAFEKRVLKSMFNTKTWLDFIAYPNEKKQELKKKLEDTLAKRTQYYYTELANGEILKVPACSKLEARDMILAIEREDIEKRYDNYNRRISHMDGNESERGLYTTEDIPMFFSNLKNGDAECKMWCIKFSDGQASYAFGSEGQRDQIMKEAEESKKAIIDYYKKVVLKYKDGDDNNKNKTMRHLGIGKQHSNHGYAPGEQDDEQMLEELFTPPTVDDMIEIKNVSMYSPITSANEKDFSEPTTSVMQWKSKQYPTYRLQFGPTGEQENEYMIDFKLPASKDDEVSVIMQSIINGIDDYIQKEQNTISFFKDQIENSGTDKNKFVILKFDINSSSFNIVCYDNRVHDDSTNRPSNQIDREANSSSKGNLIFYSEIRELTQTIEEALRNAYSDSNLERGVRNEYNSNYMRRPGLKLEILPQDNTIDWITIWNNEVVPNMKLGATVKGQVVKQTGNEQIRQDVDIRLAA